MFVGCAVGEALPLISITCSQERPTVLVSDMTGVGLPLKPRKKFPVITADPRLLIGVDRCYVVSTMCDRVLSPPSELVIFSFQEKTLKAFISSSF